MRRVAIVGASGFTGAELLRLCDAHPQFEVVVATGDRRAGEPMARAFPSLAAAHGDRTFDDLDLAAVASCDLVFLCLPHEASMRLVPQLLGSERTVVDLSAAYRLRDAAAYGRWYGFVHEHPELLGTAAYGLPELNRRALPGARLVATPGCYVTAASLALAPLVAAGWIARDGVIVDAASGVSGAGAAARDESMFVSVDSNVVAYGLLDHRHTPEMEQVIGASVLFTPHLVPMSRGILATCYGRPGERRPSGSGDLLDALAEAYAGEPFVVVDERPPATKSTLGSNSVHLSARWDERTGTAVVLAALDNLAKGASGGAVQAANVALGLEETAGLARIGLAP